MKYAGGVINEICEKEIEKSKFTLIIAWFTSSSAASIIRTFIAVFANYM